MILKKLIQLLIANKKNKIITKEHNKEKSRLKEILHKESTTRQRLTFERLFIFFFLVGALVMSWCSQKPMNDISIITSKMVEANSGIIEQEQIISIAKKTIDTAEIKKLERQKIKTASEDYIEAVNSKIKEETKEEIKDEVKEEEKATFACYNNGKMSEPLEDSVSNYTFSGDCNQFKDVDTWELIKWCWINKNNDLCLRNF